MIEASRFPRVAESDELVLRLLGLASRTAIELVEMSDGRIAAGTIYARLSRLARGGFVQRHGRWYLLTELGRRLLRACEAAARAFGEGEVA